MNRHAAGLRLSPGRVAGTLALAAAGIALGGLVGQVLKYQFGVHRSFGFIQQLNLNEEQNLATWFSAGLLLACAVLLWVIACARRGQHASSTSYWYVLAATFTLLSVDEAACFHERTMDGLRAWLKTDGYLYYPWVLIGVAFALAVFVAYIPFLWRLPRRSRHLFLLSGAIYLTGSVIFEMIGGRYASVHGEANLTFGAMAHVEESLELTGAILFIYALLDYLRSHVSPLIVRFEAAPAREAVASPAKEAGALRPAPRPELGDLPDRIRAPAHLSSTSS